jgi:hypothetical protein
MKNREYEPLCIFLTFFKGEILGFNRHPIIAQNTDTWRIYVKSRNFRYVDLQKVKVNRIMNFLADAQLSNWPK